MTRYNVYVRDTPPTAQDWLGEFVESLAADMTAASQVAREAGLEWSLDDLQELSRRHARAGRGRVERVHFASTSDGRYVVFEAVRD